MAVIGIFKNFHFMLLPSHVIYLLKAIDLKQDFAAHNNLILRELAELIICLP